MRAVLFPLMLLAGLGFALSLVAHLASFGGARLPGGSAVFALHAGIFVVWIPTVLVLNRVSRGARRRDLWKVALSGCPRWLRLAVPIIFGYGFLNFLLFMASTVGSPKTATGDAAPGVVRGFSGHWLIFYSAAFAVIYSARNWPALLLDRRCSSHHVVSPTAQYCESCGERMPSRESGA